MPAQRRLHPGDDAAGTANVNLLVALATDDC